MRNVLFITYCFPPSADPSVYRSARFVRHLPEFGWHPTVLTVTADTYRNPGEYGVDPHAPVDPDARCVRTASWTPVGLHGVLMATHTYRLAWTLLTPFFYERQALWFFPGTRAGRRLLREQKFDLIYTSAPPFTAHLIGWRLAAGSGVPWIADLRDPLTDCSGFPFPSRFHRQAFRRLERASYRAAARIIANNPAARTLLLRSFGDSLDASRVAVLGNGYDEEMFPDGRRADRPRRAGAARFVYTGALVDVDESDLPAGGGRVGDWFRREFRCSARIVDRSTRSLFYFLQAWAHAIRLAPDLAGRMEFHLYGRLGPKTGALVRRLGLEASFFVHDPFPHDEIPSVLASADFLFLPLETPCSDLRSPYVPGKLYEYLASGTPIFLLTPPGSDTLDILNETAGFLAAPPSDIPAIAGRLSEAVRQVLEGRPPPRRMDKVRAYTRRGLARRLAGLMDEAAGDSHPPSIV